MWTMAEMPQGSDGPGAREQWIRRFAEEQARAYSGTVFLCASRSDQERRDTFAQAAQAAGCTVLEGRAAGALAEASGRRALFVDPAMEDWLGTYLDACPAGARHLLLYTRRRGNGPSPRMSLFMEFWEAQGVDILDFGYVDKPELKEWLDAL